MQTYSVGALLKFLIGILTISILYKYVNIYHDPTLGMIFGFLGVFMLVWGLMYFFFLGMYKLFGSQENSTQFSLSYKCSLVFSIYVLTNLTLMINYKRTIMIGGILLIAFLSLLILIGYETNKINE